MGTALPPVSIRGPATRPANRFVLGVTLEVRRRRHVKPHANLAHASAQREEHNRLGNDSASVGPMQPWTGQACPQIGMRSLKERIVLDATLSGVTSVS